MGPLVKARTKHDGKIVEGWIIRDKNGNPAHFELKGWGGRCVGIDAVEIIAPVTGSLTVTVTTTKLEVRGSVDDVRKVIDAVLDRALNRNPGHDTVIPPFKH